ncbi:MAG TPA: isoprenyl transferase [Elusimicrobia bacterium]|jgi:undecaprenyl diphosphate synthase|nr:isoprenyl transferase [Elusimicrobiota bacterium]
MVADSDKFIQNNNDLVKQIELDKLPKHIAIIMDGNGRWAKKHHLPRVMGHRAGVETIREIIRSCSDLGIKVLTLFAFSTENWQRPKSEVKALMRLLKEKVAKETNELKKNNVQFRISGRIEELPEDCLKVLKKAVAIMEDNNGLILNIALNYGGRQEIIDAINLILERGIKKIKEDNFSKYLYIPDLPDPDLLIRTSGEYRISNFLLWQIAYTEIYVTPVLWPDFKKDDLYQAIIDYQHRERRFGRI